MGEVKPLPAPICLVEYDPAWPVQFQREAERIRAALCERVLRLEHAGSTAVPLLRAKPILDLALAVADSAREADYSPALEAAGYRLHLREPDWWEHRLFKRADPAVNLHVFTAGCPEIDRMLLFRDWLRSNSADRERYAAAKRELAQRPWKNTQEYADAKTAIVQEILARAQAASTPPL